VLSRAPYFPADPDMDVAVYAVAEALDDDNPGLRLILFISDICRQHQ
jgi:hypothetical protein